MDPLLYVEEEFRNVERALDESLRYDYGPGQTVDYYEECRFRLKGIEADLKRLKQGGDIATFAIVSQLWDLANRLTLIERSHLGEFSWPFADAIRQKAASLLAEEEGLRGRIKPIIHTIAAGTSYQIQSEKILNANKRRRLFTVAFPRQLKHHVLMHALFGHELGHATFYSTRLASGGGGDRSPSHLIIDVLRREGPLRDCASTMSWLTSEEAPPTVRERTRKSKTSISEGNLEHWHVELVCDLFGLLIFGPAFSAAHRTYLEPSCKSQHEVEVEKTSHPSYALRRALLTQALRVLRWNNPVTPKDSGVLRQAEEALLVYIGRSDFGDWAEVFTDAQLEEALTLIREHFELTGTPVAQPPDAKILQTLFDRLIKRLPPIGEERDDDGVSRTFEVRLEDQLHAGWTYWLGRDLLGEGAPLDFFQLNQLCDLALLQQQAIDLVAGRKTL